MKKFVSMILLGVLVFSLCAATAFAEPMVNIYTLASGDTVLTLCTRNGVDYQSNRALIMALNGITNEADFARMPVGSRVVIPVSAAAAAMIANSRNSVPTTQGTTTVQGSPTQGASTPAATSAPGQAKNIIWGDKINGYIISYVVQPGDTIMGIYASRDLSYKTYASKILQLNNLSALNSLKAGKTLLLPVPAVQAGDTVVYTVMMHTMKAGETVYSVVQSGYGLDYKQNQQLLSTFNGKDNLGSFRVGEPLYIAVTTYISPEMLANAAK